MIGWLIRNTNMRFVLLMLAIPAIALAGDSGIAGQVTDPQGKAVSGAQVRVAAKNGIHQESASDEQGQFAFDRLETGEYTVTADAGGFRPVRKNFVVTAGQLAHIDLQFVELSAQKESIVITANPVEPEIDLRNAEVFNRTLFTRDDQVLQQLNAGINAGQHEGGGKSLEIRRFGFNLDHGGVNGGLKVMVDDVQQNQGSQGHGQGYLGSLKALSPELIQDVTIINGPFSAEYGDFSGLGVVHIRQRESLPEQYTVRLQGGNFDTGRGFFAFSPDAEHVDAYRGVRRFVHRRPVPQSGRYRRDNVNANYTKSLSDDQKLGFRFLFGRNDFYSSGQIPLDLVNAGSSTGSATSIRAMAAACGWARCLPTTARLFRTATPSRRTASSGARCSISIRISLFSWWIPCMATESSSMIRACRKG